MVRAIIPAKSTERKLFSLQIVLSHSSDVFCLSTHCAGTLSSPSLVGCYFGLSQRTALLPRNFDLPGFKLSAFSITFSFLNNFAYYQANMVNIILTI